LHFCSPTLWHRRTAGNHEAKGRNTGAAVVVFPGGGYRIGLLTRNLPIAQWPRLVEKWLRTIGMVDMALAR
jgi:hypothetical protein